MSRYVARLYAAALTLLSFGGALVLLASEKPPESPEPPPSTSLLRQPDTPQVRPDTPQVRIVEMPAITRSTSS